MIRKNGAPRGWSPGEALNHRQFQTAAIDQDNIIYLCPTRKFQPRLHHLADSLVRLKAYRRAVRQEQHHQLGKWPDPAHYGLRVSPVNTATAIWS